jgi:hypothetical protein
MDRANIQNLIQRFAAQEEKAGRELFLAPCLPGSKVRVRIAGMIRTYRPRPADLEGWGLFRPADSSADFVEEPALPEVSRYLEMLRPMRVRLAHSLRGKSWLAYPMNESDWRQRVGEPRPIVVHLVDEGAQFEVAIVRGDGSAFWFQMIDRKADPIEADDLRRALRDVIFPAELRRKGLSPEARAAYDLAACQAPGFDALRERKRRQMQEETSASRLENALRMGGGRMQSHTDRGDFWLVEWTDRDGRDHTSAIGKEDLTVISSGICLSGQDRHFDLSSLVGVMDGWYGDWDE